MFSKIGKLIRSKMTIIPLSTCFERCKNEDFKIPLYLKKIKK